MNNPTLSPRDREIESQFDSPESNYLQVFALRRGAEWAKSNGLPESNYEHYLVRRNKQTGTEILGPKTFHHVGNYPEETLYGATGSLLPNFRPALRALADHASRIVPLARGEMEAEQMEYLYQVTLFWTEFGKLKDFLGLSPDVSEIVTEFLTARFQFIGKDTPVSAVKVLAQALTLAADANRYDAPLVDRIVQELETGGMDSLAFDALRKTNA